MERESNVAPAFRFYQRLAARRFVDLAEVAEELHEELGGPGFGDAALAPALAHLNADVAAGAVDPDSATEALGEVAAVLDDLAPPRSLSESGAVLVAGMRPTDALAASWLVRLAGPETAIRFVGDRIIVSELVAAIRSGDTKYALLATIDDAGLARLRHALKMLRREGCTTRVVAFLPGDLAGRTVLDAVVREWGAAECVTTYAAALRKLQESGTLAATPPSTASA